MKSLSRLPPPPQQINDYLNGHIIGHYVMKKALSVAIYNHFSSSLISRYKNKPTKTFFYVTTGSIETKCKSSFKISIEIEVIAATAFPVLTIIVRA